MIDLNDSKYIQEEFFTKEDLLKHYSEYEIFKMYVGDFTIGEVFKSPIRSGDDNPSFNIFYSKRNNCLLFKDFAGRRGDFVTLVQELYHIANYNDALQKIASDFGLSKSNGDPKNKNMLPVEIKSINKVPYQLSIKKREWSIPDINYWKEFNISLTTLRNFNVVPIEGYFNSSYYVKTPGLAFAYLEYKDDTLTYKIYRPKESKNKKWRNNNLFGVHQGYRQLPMRGSLLIITKALKEVMSLYELYHIPAIAVQSETCYIKETVIAEYNSRFAKVITLFDNDKQGREQADAYYRIYHIDPVFIPEEYKAKNFTDLVYNLNINNDCTKQIILSRLREKLFTNLIKSIKA